MIKHLSCQGLQSISRQYEPIRSSIILYTQGNY